MYALNASLVWFIACLEINKYLLCCSKQVVDLELKQENFWVQLVWCVYGVVGRL